LLGKIKYLEVVSKEENKAEARQAEIVFL